MAPVDSDDEKTISQVKTKKKPSTPTISKVKKEESVKKPKKEQQPKNDKKNVKKEEEEKENATKKREKKVYNLPGQKRDPPPERDPLRIFYESLHQQTPTSEMAAVWMMESGLLPLKDAERLYEMKMSSKNRKLTSPTKLIKKVKEMKSVTVKKKAEPSTPKTSSQKKVTTVKKTTTSKQTRKRKSKESSDEDDDEDGDSSDDDEDSEEEFSVSTKKAVKKV